MSSGEKRKNMNTQRELKSSLAELETRILMAGDLEFCAREEANQALVRIEELQGVLNSVPQKVATRH